MITPTRLSYGVLAATIILAGLLHLGVPLLVVLFSYFALRQLYFLTKRKWLALILFGVVVAGIAAAAVFLTRLAVLALPNVLILPFHRPVPGRRSARSNYHSLILKV